MVKMKKYTASKYKERRTISRVEKTFSPQAKLLAKNKCLVLILLAATAPAIPTVQSSDPGNCNVQCTNDGSHNSGSSGGGAAIIPDYKEGISYHYEYETESVTQLWTGSGSGSSSGNGKEESRVNLKGFAILTAITPCYYDLTFTRGIANTQKGSNTNGKKTLDIPASSLRFHYENGTVGQVCTSRDDPHWSANIKRGILSLLQISNSPLSADPRDEDFKVNEMQLDVAGRCPVHIEKRGNVYYKRKDLSKCSGREAGPSFLNGVPYESTFTSIPLLDSKLVCKQEIYANLIQTSMCTEMNVVNVNPFSLKRQHWDFSSSSSPSAPNITLKTQISLIKQTSSKSDFQPTGQASDYSPSSIKFEFRNQEKEDQEELDDANNSQSNNNIARNKNSDDPEFSPSAIFDSILESLCNDFESEDVSMDAPEHFLKLKEALHRIDTEQLTSAYAKITSNSLCPNQRGKLDKIFLKTLAKSTSSSAIGLLSQLMVAGDLAIDGEIAAEFLKSLAFAPRPGKRALAHLTELVRKKQAELTFIPPEILLSISGYAYQYCRLTNPECGKVDEYQGLIDTLAVYTQERCKLYRENDHENAAIVALQALGNLQTLTGKAVEAISTCLAIKESNRIRSHSLSAFRRDPCQPLLKGKVRAIFTNNRVGSDLRIHAYLATMRCLQTSDISTIQRALDNEQSNQLSSFIYSHISNQLESSSPGKEAAKKLWRKFHLDREFPKPIESFGRFSKNIELSLFSPGSSGSSRSNSNVDMGIMTESNIIYSHESYIPRTATFNLTLDLLGRSYNFIEVGVHLESFENLLNRFNAPRFSFPSAGGEGNKKELGESDNEPDFGNYDYESTDDTENEILKTSTTTAAPAVDLESDDIDPDRKPLIDPDDLQSLKNQVTTIPSRYRDDGACDTFVRIYGTTVSTKSYQQKYLPKFYDVHWIIDKYEELIESFKDVIIERTKPISLIEEHIVVAGTNGLPLNFMLDASSILSSNYSLHLDIPAIFSNTLLEKEMRLRVIPNVASLVRARISVGPETAGSAFQAGFQWEGKVHLSGAADFSLEKKENSLRINYHFPLEKFRVFELETKLVWVETIGMGNLANIIQRKVEIGPKNRTETHISKCTTEEDSASPLFNLLSPYKFGLQYCYTMTLPREVSRKPFWLQGPFKLKISSEKLDPGMKGFSLDINMNEKTTDESGLTITLDAPGSSTNRKVVVVAKFIDSTLPEIHFKVDYPSPNSPFNLIAKIHDSRTRKGISASLTRGNEDRQTATYYECALSVESQANGREIVYQPICYSRSGSTSSGEERHFAQGKVIRGLGKYLDVDLQLTSPLTDNNLEIKGLLLVNRTISPSTSGSSSSSGQSDFTFTLEKGEFSYNNNRYDGKKNNAVITTRRDDSLYFLINGELFRHKPKMGINFDLRYGYGTGRKETSEDLKLSSNVSYLPSQLFAIETLASSTSSKALNVDFKLSTELVDETKTKNETSLTVDCSMNGPYFFEIHALRKGGTNSGSLNMTADLPSIGRKLALYTNRRHRDLDQLITFDFESSFKWHVGVDDSKTMAVKFNFQREEKENSYFIESTNKVVFIGKNYRVFAAGIVPKNLTNGEYLLSLTYISPRDSTYAITYKNMIARDAQSNVASELEVQLQLPRIEPISVVWKKSFFALQSGGGPEPAPYYGHGGFRLLNNLVIFHGEEIVFYFQVTSTLEKNARGRLLQNQAELRGFAMPLEIKLNHDLVLLDSIGFENQLNIHWGEDRGKFIVNLTPTSSSNSERGDKEQFYRLQVNWEPQPALDKNLNVPGRFILDPLNLMSEFGGHLTSRRNFKVQNRGFLKMGSTISLNWIDVFDLHREGIDLEMTLNLPLHSASTSLKLKAGLEIDHENKVIINTAKKVGVLHLSTKIPNILDFSTDLKLDPESPLNYLKVSLELPPAAKISINHENERGNYVTIVSAVLLQQVTLDLSNRFLNSPTSKSLDSFLKLSTGGETPTISRNLSLTLDKVETKPRLRANPNSDQWNVKIVQTVENDQTVLKAFGTIALSTNSFQGTLQAPKFYGKSGSLQVNSNFDDSRKSLKLSGKFGPGDGPSVELIDFNFTSWLTETQKGDSLVETSQYKGQVSLPIFLHLDDLDLVRSLRFRSPFELSFTVTNSQTEEEGQKVGSEYQVELENAAKIHDEVTLGWKFGVKAQGNNNNNDDNNSNNNNRERLFFSTIKCQDTPDEPCSIFLRLHNEVLTRDLVSEEGKHEQSYKILSIHTVREGREQTAVNISSGLLWSNEFDLDPESSSNKKRSQAKSLCFVSQKEIKLGGEFGTCTLGFTSRAHQDEENNGKRVLDMKLALLDKITFQGVKVDESDSVSFNSSFWLDSISKPQEELRLSVSKRRVGASQGFGAGNHYFIGVKHPFLPRDLKVSTTIQHEAENPNYNGVAELDIFEKPEDKITLMAKYSTQSSGAFQDDFFDDFNDDEYTQPEGSSSSSSGGKFEASVISTGLPLQIKVESSLDSSGVSYSFLDRTQRLRTGKLVLRIPSLLDSNVLQIGETPIIAISFGGVPKIHVNGLATNTSLLFEYHGSPHSSLRIYGKSLYEEEEEPEYNEDGDKEVKEVENYYSLSLPSKSEDNSEAEFSMLLQKDEPGVTKRVVNLDISLNTSKLLRVETKWGAEEIRTVLAELRKLQSAIRSEIRATVIASSKDSYANVVAWSKTIFKGLPSIRPLLNKLEKEFQEDLEAIQKDPHSNVIYEFVSGSMLRLYQRTKAMAVKTSGVVEKAGGRVYSFLEYKISSMHDIESDVQARLSTLQDEVLGAFVLSISKLKLMAKEAKIKFQEYLENNPEFQKMYQAFKAFLSSCKVVLQKVTRKILQKTIAIRPYLRMVISKEVHEFLITFKNYALDKLQLDDKGGSRTREATNVTAEVVIAKGYETLSKMGMGLLERKGFVFQLENESAIIQFPLPKPVRTIRQAFSKTELIRPTYTQGLSQFYHWITRDNNNGYDSRTLKLSAVFSRLQNALFGGIGPQDSVSLIINGQYFRTFDGTFHRYDGSCQYLLAADFLTGNVSLAIEGESQEQGQGPRLIFTDGDESLVIHSNATLEFNGKLREIPKTETFEEFVPRNIGSFKAYRYDNVLGEVTEVTKDHSGVDVACLALDGYPICSIRLKNYLFGRSLGLLGSNDLETYNDFSTPNGEVVGKTTKFYRSFRINHRECTETRGSQPLRDVSANIRERCAQLFTSNESPMRACFPVIYPVDFQEVCESLASDARNEAEIKKAICAVAASYYMSCTEQFVKIDLSQTWSDPNLRRERLCGFAG